MTVLKDWKIEFRHPKELIPYDNNVKKHPPEQVRKIVESIKKGGFDVPIVVDRNNVIIKGHGRRLACLELGLEKVPVIVRYDLTDDQVKAARLADNRAAISDIDPDLLRAELAEIDPDLLEGIYDDKELDFMNADLGEMSTDAFVADMDKVVADQKKDIEARSEKAAAARVPVAKAFGFKDIPGSGQIAITRLMALAETETGLKDGDALIAWANKLAA